MTLQELLNGISIRASKGDTCKEITGLCFDSRKARPGHVFVAVRGYETDGHLYIGKAVASGASCVVCEHIPTETVDNVTYVEVPDSSEALGLMSSAYFGNPTMHLKVIGVTGTNGKTSTATLLYHLFRRMGKKCGLLSTVCNFIEGQKHDSSHTTPDPVEMNSLFAQMVQAGCEYAFMEVSSHSVVQKRIAGIDFDGGIFTNITRDHLDYHKTMDAYIRAKKAFFDALTAKAFALTNIDDRNGRLMLQNTKAHRYGYSLQSVCDFKTRVLEESLEGMLLEINGREVYTRFTGRFNAYNLTAVYGAASLLGMPENDILTAMSILRPVAGRFETVQCKGFTAIVDYAHTPDALENVLGTINDIKKSLPGSPKVITVVGCGGNRDKGKRPMMGKIATRMSDLTVFTSDNPRMENPQTIIDEIVAGVDASCPGKYLCITDRRQAIRAACTIAQKGDIVLVAGKGHETYQIIGKEKHHFNDVEEIAACGASSE